MRGVFKEIKNIWQSLDEPSGAELEDWQDDAEAEAIVRAASFVFDTDPSHAEQLIGHITQAGVDGILFEDAGSFVDGLTQHRPKAVFLEVQGDGGDAIEMVFALGQAGYAGGVQLMSHDASPVLETVRVMGLRASLKMVPAVPKPLDLVTVRKSLRAQDVDILPVDPASLTLPSAFASDWVEFWYQPKIDLRRKQIAGIECFARMRHPELGMIPPGDFMARASDSDLMLLAERSLISALKAAVTFARIGVNLRLAVNMPVKALLALPMSDLVRRFGPANQAWPGLLIDVTEAQVADDYAAVGALSHQLAASGVNLAIDDFGRGKLSLPQLRGLPFAELKLDRAFVDGCAGDPAKRTTCHSVIDLAHHLSCVAVAIGVEDAADAKALVGMGCDVGQGFLFGQPMPEADLMDLLRARAVPLAKPTIVPVAHKPKEPRGPQPLHRAKWT